MTRRLVLHIGTEKTGTTAIQDFLAHHRTRLGGLGVHYPEVIARETDARVLAAMVADDSPDHRIFALVGARTAAERANARARWQARLAAEVRRSTAPIWLLSHEHMHSRLSSPAAVLRLAALLRPLFDDIAVILYLRNPVEHMVSLLSTAAMSGGVRETLPPPESAEVRGQCDHRAAVERWEAAFGPVLRVRRYLPAAFAGGDLIADFAEACGIPEMATWPRLPRPNESISVTAIRVLTRLNRRLPFLSDGVIAADRHALQRYVLRHYVAGPRCVPSLVEVEAYEAVFADANDWVRQRFFPGEPRLFPPYRPPAAGEALSEVEADRLAALIADLWQDRMAKVEALSLRGRLRRFLGFRRPGPRPTE